MKRKHKIELRKDKYFLDIVNIIYSTYGVDTGVILFGSRAAGNALITSDYDIAIISKSKERFKKLSLVKEKIENSNIPFKVDVIDYYSTSGVLRSEIERGITWKD